MKAEVQYNDYCGTTAADRSDLFIDYPGEMTEIIVKRFGIPIESEYYKYIGVSVYGIKTEDACASFFFKNKETQKIVKYFKTSITMQSVLDLFKRFEFQVGEDLEIIDENAVEEIRE